MAPATNWNDNPLPHKRHPRIVNGHARAYLCEVTGWPIPFFYAVCPHCMGHVQERTHPTLVQANFLFFLSGCARARYEP